MKTKHLMLASTALALLGTAQTAQADMYMSVLGGANWLEDSSGFGTNTFFCGKLSTCTTIAGFRTDADTGFVLGGAIGVHLDKWLQGLRGEVEVSYRRHDVGGNWFWTTLTNGVVDGTSFGAIDANQSTFAIMANVWYDIDMGWRVVPYVGGGAGWARVKFDGAFRTFSGFNTTTWTVNRDNGFAWQLGLGFNYEVQPGVNLGVGYRYFQGPDVEVFFGGKFNVIPAQEIENNNHSLLVNLSVDIN